MYNRNRLGFSSKVGILSFIFIVHAFALKSSAPSAGVKGQERTPKITQQMLIDISRKLQHTKPKGLAKRNTGLSTGITKAVLDGLSQKKPGLGLKPKTMSSITSTPGLDPTEIYWHANHGTPSFANSGWLKHNLKRVKQGSTPLGSGLQALEYFKANSELFKLEDPNQELQIVNESQDRLGKRHVFFRRMHLGIPIWGQEINAHFESEGEMYAVNANYTPTIPFWKLPMNVLLSKRAIEIADSDLTKSNPSREMSEAGSSLLNYHGPEAEKYIWLDPKNQTPHLVWKICIRPNFRDCWYYFLDATSGQILEKYNNTNFNAPTVSVATDLLGVSRTLNTYQVGANFYLIDGTRKSFNAKSGLPSDPKGALWTVSSGNTDLKTITHFTNTTNKWSDAAAVSAHFNMGKVYEYYLTTFNRNAIDGAGSTIISAVHVTETGKKMDNAYWNGVVMAYGDGDKTYKSLSAGLDVAAHEMTHGVIGATVNLEYKFQSGALNESIADVFGVMVDRDDWKLGEDIALPSVFPSGALRDLENPHNGGKSANDAGWQPAHMDEFVTIPLENDNGGVHVNSGIPNRACFLIANSIGREKTEKIYYRVLEAHYLNSTSQFIDMRLAAIRSATDLFGATSPEVAAVKLGFDGVGVGGQVEKDIPTPRPQDVLPVQGEEFVALINAEGGDNSLYVARPIITNDTDIVQVTKTQLYTGTGNPMAIPDDGSVILFIDKDNALRGIDDEGEQVVSATGTWKSLAVSPDGSKIAATTVIADAKIYILDLIHPDSSKTISLYTPTTGIAIKAQNVVYADALDWNSNGQYLLYDAFNSVAQTDGDPIEYWDANLVDIKSEIITPFLPSRPAGISIGDPSFSQTSDLNFAFDLFDESTGLFTVMTADLFTGGVEVIDTVGLTPGFPRYSPDDKTLVYEKSENGIKNVVQVSLAKDRISRSGTVRSYIANGQKPLWFAIGKRPAGIPFNHSKNPTRFDFQREAQSMVRYTLTQTADISMGLHDVFGRRLALLEQGPQEPGTHRLDWKDLVKNRKPLPHGIYFLSIEVKIEGEKPIYKTLKMAFAK